MTSELANSLRKAIREYISYYVQAEYSYKSVSSGVNNLFRIVWTIRSGDLNLARRLIKRLDSLEMAWIPDDVWNGIMY